MTRLTLLAVLASCAAAQPPGIIRVIRNGSIQPYAEGGAAVNVIGMSSIAGFSETWLVELHDSFASLEDLDKTLGALAPNSSTATPDVLLSPSRTLIGLYRPGLSYRPDQAAQSIAKMRYFDVVIYRVRPGTEADLGKLLRARQFGLDSINLDRPDVVYQIVSGEPDGTFIALTPLPSLRVMDDGRPATPVYAEGEQAAARKATADMDLSREHLWFRIDPRISYVSDSFASADAGFWHPGAK